MPELKTKSACLTGVLLLFASLLLAQDQPAKPAQKTQQVPTSAAAEGEKDVAVSETTAKGPADVPADAPAVSDPNASEAESPNKKSESIDFGRVLSPGRRDPFRPFTMNARTNRRARENLTPLERYELGQMKLVGIIEHMKELLALVEIREPDNIVRGYTVKVGTPIGTNDGKVKVIKPGEMIIEETHIDIYGAKKRRDVTMALHTEKAQ